MKRVSLVITKNETTKLLADINDEKAKQIVRVNKFEQQIDAVNLQVRNFSRDVIEEQSKIRQEAFIETKLKVERFRSEERVQTLKEESKILRNKTISLESTFYPIIQEIEDKINYQNLIIEKYKNDFMKLSKGTEILIKISSKQQKMAEFLKEFNKSKAKDVHKMRMVEKQQRFNQFCIDHEGNPFNDDIKEEYYSIYQRRTPNIQTSKIMDSHFLDSSIKSMKDFSKIKTSSDKVKDLFK